MTDKQNSVTPEHLEKVAHQRPFSRSAMKAWLLHAAEALREAQAKHTRLRDDYLETQSNYGATLAERDRLSTELDAQREIADREFARAEKAVLERAQDQWVLAAYHRILSDAEAAAELERLATDNARLAEENRRLRAKINHHYHRAMRKDSDHRCPWRQGLEAVRDSALSQPNEEN